MRLLPGDWGTAQTVAQIRRLIERGKKSQAINELAIGIVWNTPNFSQTAKARAIFDWVRANTRYVPMILGVQTLRTANEILQVRAGDCANLNAVLIPSLLETIGIPARLVTIAGDADDPRDFTHIFAEAFVDGRWVPMDVARPGAAFGRAPEVFYRARIWDTASAAYRDVKRLNGYLGQAVDNSGSTFATDVGAISSGVENVIAASRANPANISAGASPYASIGAGVAQAENYGYAAGPTIAGIPTWVWLLVVAGAGVAIFSGGRRR